MHLGLINMDYLVPGSLATQHKQNKQRLYGYPFPVGGIYRYRWVQWECGGNQPEGRGSAPGPRRILENSRVTPLKQALGWEGGCLNICWCPSGLVVAKKKWFHTKYEPWDLHECLYTFCPLSFFTLLAMLPCHMEAMTLPYVIHMSYTCHSGPSGTYWPVHHFRTTV